MPAKAPSTASRCDVIFSLLTRMVTKPCRIRYPTMPISATSRATMTPSKITTSMSFSFQYILTRRGCVVCLCIQYAQFFEKKQPPFSRTRKISLAGCGLKKYRISLNIHIDRLSNFSSLADRSTESFRSSRRSREGGHPRWCAGAATGTRPAVPSPARLYRNPGRPR